MKTLTDFVSQIIRASLEKSPDEMLGDFLRIVIELSEAGNGSIVGEYGPQLSVLYSTDHSTMNQTVSRESIAGRALHQGVILYTPLTPADTATEHQEDHAPGQNEQYLLTIPIPSVYHEDNSASSARFTNVLQLSFSNPIFNAPAPTSDSYREYTFEQIKQESGFDSYLANVFVLLPVLSFAMEIKNLRRTAYQAMHEVKNKFFSVQAWIQCLQEDLQDCAPQVFNNTNVNESMELVERAIQEGLDLSKDSLLFTQIYTRHFRSTDLNEVVQRAADDVRALATSTGNIEVSTELDKNVGTCYIDPDQLRIALFNIGKNAVEALGEAETSNPWFSVRTEATEDDHIQIVLEDNAGGLPDEIVNGLFLPFKSYKDGGTGLGLTITKKIVDGHNGTISCDSGKNGTRFTIRLSSTASS